MKLLLLIDADDASVLEEFYSGLHKKIGSVDLRRLNKDEQNRLKLYFDSVELGRYDRIVLQLDFDALSKQLKFLQTLPNLVFIDNVAHQDVGGDSRKERHLTFYKRIPWARVVVTSYTILERFQAGGLDVCCAPKGFDSVRSKNQNFRKKMDFELLDDANSRRRHFLELVKETYPTAALINYSLELSFEDLIKYTPEYKHTNLLEMDLDELYLTVCPDIGIAEYRGRVFEAMSCGQVVMCYDQGEAENRYLGLADEDNVVLFRSFPEFQEKVTRLLTKPSLARKIAFTGQALAKANHQQFDLGVKAAKCIATEMRDPTDYKLGISAFGIHF